MASDRSPGLILYHLPGFRSARPLWLYLELRATYGASVPDLQIHEFPDVILFRTSKPAWFLELNPNGKVPVLVDETCDVVMWDGCAICMHLLDRYDTKGLFLPRASADAEGVRIRALFQQMSFYCIGTLDNLAAVSSPLQRTTNSLEGGPNFLARANPVGKKAWHELCAPFLESLLSESMYLGGPKFSAIDIIVCYSIFLLDHDAWDEAGKAAGLWLDPSKHQKLWEYSQRVRDRPARVLSTLPYAEWGKEAPAGVTCVEAMKPKQTSTRAKL